MSPADLRALIDRYADARARHASLSARSHSGTMADIEETGAACDALSCDVGAAVAEVDAMHAEFERTLTTIEGVLAQRDEARDAAGALVPL